MSEAYTTFAAVYDMFMDNVPYEEWADFIYKELKSEGITDGLVLDLGCGTGTMTRLLSDKGFDMIGVDASDEMLQVAMAGSLEAGQSESNAILYLCQDMREFELYGTVKAVVSVCDSMNYITDEADFLHVLTLVNNYLDPDGLFIFDLNTPWHYMEELADNTFAESREDAAFIWDNYFDKESGINEYELTLFQKAEDGLFARNCECHYEKAYSLEEVKKLLEKAGMEFVRAYADYSQNQYEEDSNVGRMVIIAREKQQDGKLYL